MKYRPDIDGLRAVAVIAVIFFHSGFNVISGGYTGVDIFFVISAYLITGLVFDEVKAGTFTFVNFYKRRIARILPALVITLFIVMLFGFFFYSSKAFNSVGKETFFSAIGAANILFARGVNYFVQENSLRPLMHLWSLGVEEQFYLVWPAVLIILALLRFKNILLLVAVLFFVSLYMAVVSVGSSPITTYFYPQYRAFELLIGAFTALAMRSRYFSEMRLSGSAREVISYISLGLIILPMFLLDKDSTFPGVNTLYSCLGTALFIAFSRETSAARALGYAPLVFIGLISYPLYLYHQPIISYIQFFGVTSNKIVMIAIVLFISAPLSWLTYRYIEKPVRKLAHRKNKSSKTLVVSLTACMVFIAASGMFVAKTNGFGMRFKILNPFAIKAGRYGAPTFPGHFSEGMNVSEDGRILFVGDSVLQQYVYPMTRALGLDEKEIDTVTRGGCVLLKGVEFMDTFSFISCNDLRDRLYKIKKHYDSIVISQSWDMYDKEILNAGVSDRQVPLNRWTPFIVNTIEHFKAMTDNIILIGSHLKVEGASELRPTIFLSEKAYRSRLSNLRVSNADALRVSRPFFEQWQSHDGVIVIHPEDCWSEGQGLFKLHDENWSFFTDSLHAGKAGTGFIVKKLKAMERLKHLEGQ